MGKLTGIIHFTGSFEELSFYKTDQCPDQIVVRRKGGFYNKPTTTHPNYKRTQDMRNEFGYCARAGAAFRRALIYYLKPMAIPNLPSKVQQLLMRVMVLDVVSEPGKRKVIEGVRTEQGRALFLGFEFNTNRKLSDLFAVPYAVSLIEGQLVLSGFDSSMIVFSESASFAQVRFIVMRMCFAGLNAVLSESEPLLIQKGSSVAPLVLSTAIPEGDGLLIGFLHLTFSQDVNGQNFPLKESAMRVVGVAFNS